ncbi:DNA helicase-2 / ATP-dependent DNA helicase PcrA [Prosthecobacter debontii]|uniref:DNA 3'-5' helicase n=1 Tax=Prosthecobacter debontii TaxID=48467 RepID=A0A1T4YG03_9BACT|nr:ATP-dependent helicase [Prosthecobacter debontii]SKB00518.1 DNA helicase-2 / ATP-dependent DNA helicase PcrA [Prosthecobacter debontii]
MARNYTLHTATAAAPRIDYQAELNEQQYAAVTAPPGQTLVIAGAGSGKTRTLTYRVAWLLDNGVLPEQILLLTFTNKAAREMLERVASLVTADTTRMWGGTFHSIGNKFLRWNAERLGYRKGFSIMDREDQKDLMETVINSSGIDTAGFKFPKPEVIGDIFSLADNTCTSVEEILKTRYPYFEKIAEQIVRIRKLYQDKKVETNCMDFDDLLTQSVRLLKEHEDLRERYQRQFEFVLVDEYQDTNSLQCEFVEMITGRDGNLMVVGDDAQSIYSWRGADVGNILQFHEYWPRATVHKIEVNYRSVPEVLSLANASIANNKSQIQKQLQPAREAKGQLPALVPLDSGSAQAQFIAQRILELQDEGTELNEIAILYRAHFHSMEIQMELTARGIPFQITSGLRFFEQAHVKDVAAFMKFAINRRDEVSFMRMVKLIPGVGGASALKLWNAWLKTDASQADVMTGKFSDLLIPMSVPKKARETWDQFAYTLDELIIDGVPQPPPAMIRSIYEGVYEEYMKSKFKNAEQRQQDLEQLSNYSSRFTDPLEFLSQLSLLSGVDTDNKPDAQPEDRDAVTLTTAHQAKGLEWHTVFAVWMADGMFPHARAVEESDAGLEEERRLFYVTITRAKDELYLTYPLINHQARDGDILMRPSRFITELSMDLMEKWNVRSGW